MTNVQTLFPEADIPRVVFSHDSLVGWLRRGDVRGRRDASSRYTL